MPGHVVTIDTVVSARIEKTAVSHATSSAGLVGRAPRNEGAKLIDVRDIPVAESAQSQTTTVGLCIGWMMIVRIGVALPEQVRGDIAPAGAVGGASAAWPAEGGGATDAISIRGAGGSAACPRDACVQTAGFVGPEATVAGTIAVGRRLRISRASRGRPAEGGGALGHRGRAATRGIGADRR